MDVPGYPATGDNSTSETAQDSTDTPTCEDYNHPMERGGHLTSVPLTDPIDPPIPVEIADIPSLSTLNSRVLCQCHMIPYLWRILGPTFWLHHHVRNLGVMEVCIWIMQVFCKSIISLWPMADLSWSRDESQNKNVKPPSQKITLSTSVAPDTLIMPRYVLTIFC